MKTTLYGKDKKGGFKVWVVETDDTGKLTISHGKQGGKMTVKSEQVKTKNVGRANETSLGQQAENEAQGRIKKQKDKGYRESKDDLEELPLLPMLAADYTKVGHRVNYETGVDISPKFDGVRCLAKCAKQGVVELESRTGQPYELPHISAELAIWMKEGDVLDGELYLHGYILQDITSAVKRPDTQEKLNKAAEKLSKLDSDAREGSPEQADFDNAQLIHELRPKLQFIAFDIPSDKPWNERLEDLYEYDSTRLSQASYLHMATYVRVYSEEEMKTLHKDAVKRGYEGVMLRNRDGLYESGKRSADLQKYKEMIDSEFKILDVIPDKQGNGVFECENDLNDETFTVVMGDLGFRAQALQDKDNFIGKYLTVAYQSRYKGTLLPQFPAGKVVRAGKVVDGVFIPSE